MKNILSTILLSAVIVSVPAAAVEPIKAKTVSPAEDQRARNYFTDTEVLTHLNTKERFYSDVLKSKGVVLINVMYANCEGACPMLTQVLSRVSKKLGDRFGKDIFFVSISNDPVRDTPKKLKTFIKKQKVNEQGWTFLTGKQENVNYIIKKLGLYSENYEQHTSMMIAGNIRTGHWKKLQPNMPLAGIALKLEQLANEG